MEKRFPYRSFAEALTPQVTQWVAAFTKMSGIVVIHDLLRHRGGRSLQRLETCHLPKTSLLTNPGSLDTDWGSALGCLVQGCQVKR